MAHIVSAVDLLLGSAIIAMVIRGALIIAGVIRPNYRHSDPTEDLREIEGC